MGHHARKTEHVGPKRGRGGYYGRKRDAKHESAKRRRGDDRSAVLEVSENLRSADVYDLVEPVLRFSPTGTGEQL